MDTTLEAPDVEELERGILDLLHEFANRSGVDEAPEFLGRCLKRWFDERSGDVGSTKG